MSPVLVMIVNYGIPLFTHLYTKSFCCQTPSPITQGQVIILHPDTQCSAQ